MQIQQMFHENTTKKPYIIEMKCKLLNEIKQQN